MSVVDLGPALLERIYAHARAAFPLECCGYIRGDEVVPCTNAIADGTDRFLIDGPELFAFARAFDSTVPPRIVYHSHPNGRAYFSATDHAMAKDAAYPVEHLVVGVTADRVTEAALFARDGRELARWEVA